MQLPGINSKSLAHSGGAFFLIPPSELSRFGNPHLFRFLAQKRCNVFRVSIAYLAVGWLILQVAQLVLESISAPDWVMQIFLLAVAIGFPVACAAGVAPFGASYWVSSLMPRLVQKKAGYRCGDTRPWLAEQRYGRRRGAGLGAWSTRTSVHRRCLPCPRRPG
jgi:hypothetical protein